MLEGEGGDVGDRPPARTPRQGGRGTLAGEDGGVGDPPPARTPLEVGGGDAEAGRAWGPGGWGGGARRRQREERSPGEGRTRPRLT